MRTTYNVRLWKTEVYRGARVTTHYVRWVVDGQTFREPFRNQTQAESFRSELVTATRKGEAFYVATGLPVSMERADKRMSWYDFACAYADSKWPQSAATTRRTVAEALTAVTSLMLTDTRGMPDEAHLRAALKRWAFNTKRRNIPDRPEWVNDALQWASRNTRPVAALTDPTVLRGVLDGLALKLDGTPRAASVVSRWRKILNNAVEQAIERKILAVNPIPALKWRAPKSSHVVDRRCVVNPSQARALFKAVHDLAPHLEAFYGSLYYAALRPEEAANLTNDNLDLPREGWGEIHLDGAKPHAGGEWTDTGKSRDQRQLKQRAVGETRTAPCPPELTAMLQRHLARFGTTADERLFVGERNTDHLPAFTVFRVWKQARRAVFGTEAERSPLAARPYDLRHAGVSTWLNAGVDAAQVADWAGHSVDVLLRIYAKCIDGNAARNRTMIDQALGRSLGD